VAIAHRVGTGYAFFQGMTVDLVSVLAWVLGTALVGWKVRQWLRAFIASRRMRLFYEGQPPEKRKEIEASWKRGSLNGAYTKPVPVGLVILSVLMALLFLAGLAYFMYVKPMGFHMHR
jgi:hypothetical protein